MTKLMTFSVLGFAVCGSVCSGEENCLDGATCDVFLPCEMISSLDNWDGKGVFLGADCKHVNHNHMAGLIVETHPLFTQIEPSEMVSLVFFEDHEDLERDALPPSETKKYSLGPKRR